MKYEELIASSNMAFGSGQYSEALAYARSAIEINEKSIEAYLCAGKACMSLDIPNKAIEYYKKAINIDKKNGTVYFFLGYAQVLSGDIVSALRSLTKSLENNCDDTLRGQIYKILAMINREMGDYKNALINIDQAEAYIELDSELLQERAICYARQKDYHQTVYTLNQMKLLQPSDYQAYSLAVNIFMELGIYDEAKAELERAEKYADLTMAYYNDRIAYALLHDPANDTQENIKPKWQATIEAIDVALKKGKPTSEQVFELYLRAAQLYLSLENPTKAITILDAAVNPVFAFNNGFSVLLEDETEAPVHEVYGELSPEDEEIIMQKKWDNGDFEEIRENTLVWEQSGIRLRMYRYFRIADRTEVAWKKRLSN